MEDDGETGDSESVLSEFESERESSDTEGEDNESRSDESDQAESEKRSSDDDTSSDELEDNAAYRDWFKQANDATSDTRKEKYEKYIQEGIDEENAIDKANMKTLWSVKKFFFERYETFMGRYFQLKEDDTYLDMVADIEEKIDKEVQLDKAIKRVMIKYRDKFDPLF